MKHLKTFERWENPNSEFTDKLRKFNDIIGTLDDENDILDEDELKKRNKEETELVPELLEVKDILDAAGIKSHIEVLPKSAYDEVGQFHILSFEYNGDKLYSTGWAGDREIDVRDYGHRSRIEYQIPLNVEDYTTCVEDLEDPKEEFNRILFNGPEDEHPGIDSSAPTQEQRRQFKIQEFRKKILRQIEAEKIEKMKKFKK